LFGHKPLPGGTDIFITELEMEAEQGLERTEACRMENEKFVGATATFEEDGTIVPLRPDLCPKRQRQKINSAN